MPAKIFFCYAHEDEPLLLKLKIHLKPLQREGLIDVWYDRDISAGAEWGREIDKHLNSAQIILLLVSPDFMNSDYCYGVELARARERHVNGEARVIPIILRPASWQGLLGKFQALPKDGRPIKSRYWHNMDEAFSNIAEGIRNVAGDIIVKSLYQLQEPPIPTPSFSDQSLGVLVIHVQCYDRFFEVTPDEVENAQLIVEDMVSHVLINLFSEGTVDDVAIRFSPKSPVGLQHCSIQIRARCVYQRFALLPRTRENMEFAIEESICSLLREIFGTVTVEQVNIDLGFSDE